MQVAYLRQSVAAAEKALEIALIEFTLGTRDFTPVLTAEQNLYTAQNDLAIASGNVSAGLTSVFRALGGGWQIRGGPPFRAACGARANAARTNWGNLLPPAVEQAAAGPRGCRPPRIVGPRRQAAGMVRPNVNMLIALWRLAIARLGRTGALSGLSRTFCCPAGASSRRACR